MSTLLETHTLGQVSFLKCCNVTLRNIQRTLNITTNYNYSQLSLRPLTSKSDQFFFFNAEKQTVSCGNTAKEVSFEWSHHGILSTDSKFRTIYKTNRTTSTTKEVSFKWSHHRISSARLKVRTTSSNPSCSLAVKVLP